MQTDYQGVRDPDKPFERLMYIFAFYSPILILVWQLPETRICDYTVMRREHPSACNDDAGHVDNRAVFALLPTSLIPPD